MEEQGCPRGGWENVQRPQTAAPGRGCAGLQVCLCRSVLSYVCVFEDKCPHLCVLGGQWLCVSLSVPVSELPVVSVYVCVGVCIAGLWQCMVLSLVISEHLCGAAVCTVSLCVHQRL